jgi:hypothetical protein
LEMRIDAISPPMHFVVSVSMTDSPYHIMFVRTHPHLFDEVHGAGFDSEEEADVKPVATARCPGRPDSNVQ